MASSGELTGSGPEALNSLLLEGKEDVRKKGTNIPNGILYHYITGCFSKRDFECSFGF